MNKNIIFNYSLESYNKKYRNNRYKLLSFSKKEIEDFNKKKKNKNFDFLLKNRKWALIGDTYYEIPKAPRWTWFRNLNAGVQATVISLVSIGVASAAVFPVLCETIWKPLTAGVSEKIKEYVEIETKEELVIGKDATIILSVKEEKKSEAQLPKDPTQITVTTGGVKLPYYDETSSTTNTVITSKCSSYSDSTISDKVDEIPSNYFKYTFSKDKAGIWIKEILGPVVIDMTLDERSYTVTFDPRNEVNKSKSIEVTKSGKYISESKKEEVEAEISIVDNDYRAWDNKWYLDNTEFKFGDESTGATKVSSDITLKAKYTTPTTPTAKTGVYIKGFKNYKEYSTVADAYTNCKEIMSSLGSMTEAELLNTLDDTQVINNRKVANISWYVFGQVSVDNSNDVYYLSFNREDKKINDNWDFYNTSVIGVTDNAKMTVVKRTSLMENRNGDTLENPMNFKDIEIDISGTDFVLNYQDKGTHYVLNVDNCKFDRELEVWESEIMTINVTNCVFNNRAQTKYGIEFVREDQENDVNQKPIEDVIVFRNNTIIGDNVTRGININDPYCKNAYIENNTFRNIHINNYPEDKIGTAVIQLSCGYNFAVNNNEIIDCVCNAFKLHEGLKTYSGVKIALKNNTISNSFDEEEKQTYVGVNETGRTDFYTLSSSGNTITGNVSTTKCYFDNDLHENDKYVFHI